MKRLFVAIKVFPSEKLKKTMALMRDTFKKEEINWVSPDNIHLTLLFIGSVAEQDVLLIQSILRETEKKKSVAFTIEGLDTFGKKQKPEVIYARVTAGDELQHLAFQIRTSLKDFVQAPEKRSFSPHITLGRIKKINPIEKFVSMVFDFRNAFFQDMECTEFVLFESVLTPTGPIYTTCEVFPLE